ncbi:MAG: signal peptidase II [Gemmatimonadota bacterium]|nr:signal peptidase II [Gemmatimonadota bacterium]
MENRNKWIPFWGVVAAVIVIDFITKRIAVAWLSTGAVRVWGDWLALRLVYNPGAAFGIHVGDQSRWVFMVLALIALVVLGAMVRHTHSSQWFRLTALALVCGGAVGNLIDRVRSSQGVVDFIDVFIGPVHWPTFNVADMAVSCGAIALAVVLWHEGHAEQRLAPEREQADPAEA